MIIKIRNYILKEFYKANGQKRDYEWINDLFRWNTNINKLEQTDISKFHADDLESLKKIALQFTEDYTAKALVKAIENYKSFASDETGKQHVKKLELFPEAVKTFFKDKPLKWLFLQNEEGEILPYFLEKVDYTPKRKHDKEVYPAYCTMTLKAYKRGSKVQKNLTLYQSDIGLSVGQIFQSQDIMFETPEGVEKYIKDYNDFIKVQSETGKQMYATGTATGESGDRYWRYNTSIAMVRDGQMTKIIIDDFDEEQEESRNSSRRSSSDSQIINKPGYWLKEKVEGNFLTYLNEPEEIEEDLEELEDDISTDIYLPIHPYLRIFDLDKHQYLTIHVDNLKPYPWNKTLINKLVLPDGQKNLIRMLVDNTGDASEDIIKGKMSGVIVIATGPPGTGKTLTAEIFSETIEKPLYVVQCSQLGLNTQSIEANLKDILKKAAKWKAILLIDEADVYIRQRGDEIEQNAIVGVFLRILEYYRGVLFMASNRGDVVDDAIMSRATAWIKYSLPDFDSLKEIWRVLGEQYGAKFSDSEIIELATDFDGISGRTVRNLLKLAKFLAKKEDKEINVELVKEVSQYQQLENKKKYV